MGKQQRDLRNEVLGYVERFVQENGYPPTFEEIREAIGLSSKSHAAYYLDALERQGLIERTPNSPRGLRLVGLSQDRAKAVARGYTGPRP